jgi:hypothetical protein
MSNIVVQAPRVRNGQPVTSDLVVRYTDDDPGRLPLLTILGRYSQRHAWFRDRDVYRVGEIPAAGGRAFLLYRGVEAVETDPDHDERYGVFIAYCGETSDLCECKGHAAHGRCKHVDALKALLAAGHIDRPEAGRPADPVTVESSYQTDPERSGQVFVDAPF